MAVKTSQNPKSVPVVCLYGNAPSPPAVQVICLAGRRNRELSGLVHWDRADSVVAIPLSNELSDRPSPLCEDSCPGCAVVIPDGVCCCCG